MGLCLGARKGITVTKANMVPVPLGFSLWHTLLVLWGILDSGIGHVRARCIQDLSTLRDGKAYID